MMPTTSERYTSVAIALHWLIGLCIICLLIMGLVMSEDDILPREQRFFLYQLHKSLGLSVLVLSIVRLGWRLAHQAPPLPSRMPAWEKLAAKATHVLFYLLMIGLPITGWLIVSVSPRGIPTMWFGLFEWPHLPVGAPENKEELEEVFEECHEILANGTIALLALHVAAALKHHFVDRDDVLSRMLPVVKPLGKHEDA